MMELRKETQNFIALNKFTELTNVQKKVLEFASSNKDVIALSKTGTGKTHAYLIPICEKINSKSDKVQVVISLPTRELAYQVYENALLLKEVHKGLRIALLSGGNDKKKEIAKLANIPHIVIGTPGRIKDMFVNAYFRVDFVQMFIIDEADMTLEYGFLEDIDVVFSKMVKNPEVLCFSATFPNQLQLFTKKYLNNPKIIRVEDKRRDPKIEHILVPCKHRTYNDVLVDVLKHLNPYVCLIFANSKDEADETYKYITDKGYKALLLHGGLEARERQKALKALRDKKYTYVVATDVASRGIDIDGITHVISLGFPKELEFYVHRSGRTGRNTKDGVCYALYKEEDMPAINSLTKNNNIKFIAKEFKNGNVKTAKNPTIKRKKKADIKEKEIVKQLTRKNEKVKPNYKKKKTLEAQKIIRKQRRELIKSKIKEERIERYKQQQRNKG